jgi:DNA-binding transcriptional regulator of glucitol operon
LLQQGYRLVEVSGYSVGDKDTYAAIWEKRQGPAWVAHHGMTSAQYQQQFNTLAQQGYRLIDVSGYTVAGQDHYAAIWEKTQGPPLVARHGLTAAQYQQEFNTLTQQGYRLVDISGYNVGGQDHYAAIWEKSQGPAWQGRHGMTSAQYQQEFNTLSQQGYRLTRIRGWRSGNTTHYAAIWEKVSGPAWVARHGMLSDAYQEEFDALAKQGYRLRHVSGYHTYN